ncbi:VOC family protein [Gluconacetobacter entanii]|uniref:VOC family protein n=1 Tax=Gluconacetobacter entanii TaxID=108528 RepID=A0ABT3K3N3_9PROT|nr:VOC family protein [Gluconacetobacter entanii]MCW4590007.1 VOC family protein [Gluconacetobacter entanii]MCW4593877.1 VOC family protein [Gluconacetobacter entanii]NPC89698.1 VOC family protein [Gluconacetobacter entanii]
MVGLPGLRGVEHVGFTVPDIEEATSFFVDVIGCEQVYSLGPFRSADDWMTEHLNVPADAIMRELRFFRCRNGPNFEIFQYEVSGQRLSPPLNSDVGGHHLAFYVDDFEAALAYLKRHGIRLLGQPTYRDSGPSAGQTWIYFLAPWGMQLELVSFPQGKLYEKTATTLLWQPSAIL